MAHDEEHRAGREREPQGNSASETPKTPAPNAPPSGSASPVAAAIATAARRE